MTNQFSLQAVDLSGILNQNTDQKAKQLPDPKTSIKYGEEAMKILKYLEPRFMPKLIKNVGVKAILVSTQPNILEIVLLYIKYELYIRSWELFKFYA